MKILVGAGDVGGARAIMPVLHYLKKTTDILFDIINHGYLADNAPKSWTRVDLPESEIEVRKKKFLSGFDAYVFGTSVHDTFALKVARIAKKLSVPVICVLDNWMNYKRRLEIDSLPTLYPDVYAVMDDLAKKEAIEQGIPESILCITGHPGLSDLADQYDSYPFDDRFEILKNFGFSQGKKLVVFISEPAEMDQGSDLSYPQYRGYTEKTVLKALLKHLQIFSDGIQVGIVPHPREDVSALLKIWEEGRGELQGGILSFKTGREAIFIADGICGMSSILLYEALLIGKPVLSLQPDLRLQDAFFLKKKGVKAFITDKSIMRSEIQKWSESLFDYRPTSFHNDLFLHKNSPKILCELIQAVARSYIRGK